MLRVKDTVCHCEGDVIKEHEYSYIIEIKSSPQCNAYIGSKLSIDKERAKITSDSFEVHRERMAAV